MHRNRQKPDSNLKLVAIEKYTKTIKIVQQFETGRDWKIDKKKRNSDSKLMLDAIAKCPKTIKSRESI
jgi:hypothetical protein